MTSLAALLGLKPLVDGFNIIFGNNDDAHNGVYDPVYNFAFSRILETAFESIPQVREKIPRTPTRARVAPTPACARIRARHGRERRRRPRCPCPQGLRARMCDPHASAGAAKNRALDCAFARALRR